MFRFYVGLACLCRVAPPLDAARMMEETEPVSSDSGPSDIREDGYSRTYCVVPNINNVETYIERCFKHTLMTYVYSLWTLVSECETKTPEKLTTKHDLAIYAVNWTVPGHHFEASKVNLMWVPPTVHCGKLFVSLTATAPNLDDFEQALSKHVYIVLREEDGYYMNETQQTTLFQLWFSEYFHLKDHPENYKIDTVTTLMRNNRKIYVVEFHDLAMKVTQDMVAEKGYASKMPGPNFRPFGVVSESAWLLTEPALGCPPIWEGGIEQMGYWQMSVHLAQGQQAWMLFTCELITPECTNKQRAVVKVVGKGIRGGVTWVKIPIRLMSSSEHWECTFWWLPNRWADETTGGTTKMCTVKTPQKNNSQNMCQKHYVWQIGNTDFYGQGYLHRSPMNDPMLSL